MNNAINTAAQVTKTTDLSGVPSLTLSRMYQSASTEIRCHDDLVSRGVRVDRRGRKESKLWASYFRIEDELKTRGFM